MKLWIARNQNGSLWLHEEKPSLAYMVYNFFCEISHEIFWRFKKSAYICQCKTEVVSRERQIRIVYFIFI